MVVRMVIISIGMMPLVSPHHSHTVLRTSFQLIVSKRTTLEIEFQGKTRRVIEISDKKNKGGCCAVPCCQCTETTRSKLPVIVPVPIANYVAQKFEVSRSQDVL
jgi:hypothetical protein